MKANELIRILIIFNLIFIISCGGEKERTSDSDKSPRIKKSSQINSPKINAEYVLGSEVSFDLSSSKSIDSIQLEYEGKTTTYKQSAFSWKADQAKTGFQRIKLTVYMGSESETHYPRVKFMADTAPDLYTYELINTLPHDENAYVQGLFFIGDTLVESTGREGLSKLSKLNLNTGKIYKSVSLSSEHFGEGSTIWNNKIIYLTWTSHIGYVYDRNLTQTDTFNYNHEGWGITTSGDTLFVSDGTEVIHMLDPRDFSEIGKLEVYTNKSKITQLNELEMIDGLLYANVWLENNIVVIDPKSGKVLRRIDMSGLRGRFQSEEAEAFNGIAYKQNTKQIFVTGKLWPKMFEVKFVPKS